MIDPKLKGSDLIGRKCHPVHSIRNGSGQGITSDTICTIVAVVRGHGFTIQTEKCTCCGQYAYITKVARNDIELLDAETEGGAPDGN